MTADPLQLCRQQIDLLARLASFRDVDEAPLLAAEMRQTLAASAVTLDGLVATQRISHFNDQLSTRLIDRVAQRHRLPPVNWCWLAFGSEGRLEQTLVTDQDNGLVFAATSKQEAEALQGLFLPFAQEVNRRLAECGFALCHGEVMAGNPKWCQSYDAWRSQFIDWVRRPDPAALLNASIFFDLRPMAGDAALAERLRSTLLSMTVETASFLHLMAANALQAAVPLNFRGELAVDETEEIDLKKFGSRIFVDAARIFALASGSRSVGTRQRLIDAGKAAGLPESEIDAVNAAFSQILAIRLRGQVSVGDAAAGQGACLRLAGLNEFDRVVLREALKLGKRLQQRLKLNYSL